MYVIAQPPHLDGRRDCMVVGFPVYFVSDVRKCTCTYYLIYQWYISDEILELKCFVGSCFPLMQEN
jgi:hypothetical protein